ncbi:hypothetical protein PHG31p235 [Aeromonas phage 31]|uniref:Uncharacterized protein PHG31ORF238c n=1 Tax=Aeromonas phage 31 TaxID=321023 RepID=Q56EC6_9CAUD|nr:hypothetical protein PHG31p235 [Aeromonas phage 31]AAX63724.1 hypothetical protein PHG31p235 [Aeromonas phage 31]APU01128.1 hypothetical protein [Aeromonas phage 31.2]
MLSPDMKAKITNYYNERLKWARDNSIVNLTTPDYRLVFTNHKGYVGQCNYTKREIRISMRHNQYATWESIMDTVNHELAHWATRGHGHDGVWQEMAVRFGATPRTCINVGEIQRPFAIMCRGEIVGYSDTMRTGSDAAGRYIKGRKKETYGNLVYVPNSNYIDNSVYVEPVVGSVKPVKKTNKIIADFLSDI